MAVGMFTVIATAFAGVATTAGLVAFQANGARMPAPAEDIRLVQCMGLREEFSPLLGHTRPVWVLSRNGANPETLCRQAGGSKGAVHFERVPGVLGSAGLIV